ncbi:MAG: hypothetical protein ACREDA_09420, partial [Methylocella sp.]
TSPRKSWTRCAKCCVSALLVGERQASLGAAAAHRRKLLQYWRWLTEAFAARPITQQSVI